MGSKRRLFWTLQLAGWAVFFTAMFFAGLAQWSLGYTLVRKSSLTLFGFAVTLLMRWPYRLMRRRKVALPLIVVTAISISCAGATVWMVLHNFVLWAQQQGIQVAIRHFPDGNNAVYYAFVLIAWTLLYFGVPMALDRQADRERVLQAEALTQQARLRALRLQLNPHFLFNTLNSVSTLVAEGRTAEANKMISRLSEFLRMTLDSPDRDEIPLAEEIDFARRYLDIEKSRFGDRLQVHFSISEAAQHALVPPLILQPLVENAVKHAVVPREEGGIISITASCEDGWLNLSVEDDGQGVDETDIHPAIGLTNTRDRLVNLYDADSELRFGRGARGGLAVSIRLPLHSAADVRGVA